MFKDTKEGQTNCCQHGTPNDCGICDECLDLVVEKAKQKKDLLKIISNKKLIRKLANESSRLQRIQMIVWEYMETSKEERDGVKMAIKIDNLYK